VKVVEEEMVAGAGAGAGAVRTPSHAILAAGWAAAGMVHEVEAAVVRVG